jgi:hypothetical protein
MKNGLTLQRDIHVKAMNKLLPKFTFEHSRMYNMGETVVSCKIKVKRVRKYFYNYLFTPPDEIKAIYELDVIISDVVFNDVTGRTRDPKLFIDNNKASFNKGLRWFGVEKIDKYIYMIDSNPMSIRISKIEYNL